MKNHNQQVFITIPAEIIDTHQLSPQEIADFINFPQVVKQKDTEYGSEMYSFKRNIDVEREQYFDATRALIEDFFKNLSLSLNDDMINQQDSERQEQAYWRIIIHSEKDLYSKLLPICKKDGKNHVAIQQYNNTQKIIIRIKSNTFEKLTLMSKETLAGITNIFSKNQ